MVSVSSIHPVPPISGSRFRPGARFSPLLAALTGTAIARGPLAKGLSRIYLMIFSAMIAVVIGSFMFNAFSLQAASPYLLRAGIGALFALYLALWHLVAFTQRHRKKDFLWALNFIAVGLYLNSFSSVLAFTLALLVLLLFSGRYFLFLLATFGLIAAGIGFFLYLSVNLDAVIFNNPARAFLIGTGRIAIYEYALQVYQELPLARKLFGVGFMAEREYPVGSSLSWTINVHNSFLSNLVGTGLVGLCQSLLLAIVPFFTFKKLQNRLGKEVALKWISLHVMFLASGFTSIGYPSQPSWQILFFLIFSTLLMRKAGALTHRAEVGVK